MIRNEYTFKLRFPKRAVLKWAGRYSLDYDKEVETVLAPQVRERGYLLKPEFETFCRWKTPRSQRRAASNPAEYIETVTQVALSTPNERLRIEVLLLQNGVRWPTASVILHVTVTPTPFLITVHCGRCVWRLTPLSTISISGGHTDPFAGS